MDALNPASDADIEVEAVTYSAPDGSTLKATLIGGVILPEMPGILELLKEFKQLEVRQDDMYVVSYPRTGTHWIWEVASMVVNGRAERIEHNKQIAMLESQPMIGWPLKTLPSPRIINTHLHSKHYPVRALNMNKCIFMLRNPKDVIVSLYQLRITFASFHSPYDGSFAGFVDFFLEDKMWYGGYFKFLTLWWDLYQKNKDQFLIVSYEDCQKDLPANVRRIAEFLDREKDQSFYNEVASLCGFEKMKADKGNYLLAELFLPNADGMYRRGKVGDWRLLMTADQCKAIDAKMEREIHDADLKELLRKDH